MASLLKAIILNYRGSDGRLADHLVAYLKSNPVDKITLGLGCDIGLITIDQIEE